MNRQLPSLLALLFTAGILSAQTYYQPEWSSLDSRPTPEWWTDSKFGIFIHWGVYSVPAYTTKGNYAEWYQNSLENNLHEGKIRAFHQQNYGNRTYYDLADDFHAELFNPDDWAQMFEQAGAKYVVLTSKHHDGFCLWPSEQANQTWNFPWTAQDRGPGRDLVNDLFGALRKTTVKPGLYYSLYEWYNPLWLADKERYAREHAMPQLYDLVQRYRPAILWADGDWDATPETWQSQQFLAWLYNQSPVRSSIVVNDRWGSGTRFKHGGIYTPEYQPDLDFEDHAWEESRGMGFSYGYNRAEDAEDYNSSQALVLHLVDKVSRGGNFLLDIGPDGHGQIPPIMQERLQDIGAWLKINGEAIYNTRRWRTPSQWSEGNRTFKAEMVDGWKTGGDVLLKQTIDPAPGFAVKEVFFTCNPKANAVFAIFPKYPADKRLILKNIILPTNSEVTFLGTKEKLRRETLGANTVIYLPEYNPSKMKSPYAFAVKISGYGAFTAKPQISVAYDPRSMKPLVTITAVPGASIRYTTDGSEPVGTSQPYTAPFSPLVSCKVRAKALKPGTIESSDASADVKILVYKPAKSMFQQPQPGLLASLVEPTVYNAAGVDRGLVSQSIVAYTFDLAPTCQTDKCGIVWRGYVQIPQTGGFQFWTESDDGSTLSIDNEIIVNNDGEHGMTEKSGMAYLERGWHELKVVYFNTSGAADLKVNYAPLNGAKTEFAPTMLAH